jgi:hypothetical protein
MLTKDMLMTFDKLLYVKTVFIMTVSLNLTMLIDIV